MDSTETSPSNRNDREEEIYSRPVRAGKRTYFFDVKATKNQDYFVTVTESRRIEGADGQTSFEKHKIHLYKEDFDKFEHGLSDVIGYIKEHRKA